MDKKKENEKKRDSQVDKKKEYNKDNEDYAYDFVPHLNEWVNIDEQREKVQKLEDI